MWNIALLKTYIFQIFKSGDDFLLESVPCNIGWHLLVVSEIEKIHWLGSWWIQQLLLFSSVCKTLFQTYHKPFNTVPIILFWYVWILFKSYLVQLPHNNYNFVQMLGFITIHKIIPKL